MEEKPIINCHTHIFIGKNIPPYIGKTFMPAILYRLFTIPLVIGICKFWFTSRYSPYQFKFNIEFNNLKKTNLKIRQFWQSNKILKGIIDTIAFLLILYTAYLLFQYFFKKIEWIENKLDLVYQIQAFNWLNNKNSQIAIVLFTIILIPYGRKIALLILKNSKKLSFLFVNENQAKFIARYINIGRFAYYDNQYNIYSKLKQQYPIKTKFVILPMDMEYMDAGKLTKEGSYENQMLQLKSIKKNHPEALPFVFVDPRRENVGYQDFMKWRPEKGKVILEDCFIKKYIEEEKFSGFKIYPALGYYPFDEKLLALWKYAADNGIPIMTHCIRGTIFYRGTKKEEWNYHPIFKQKVNTKTDDLDYLFLPNQKNIDFSVDFTHPLNYLCLLDEKLLVKLVQKAKDDKIRELFGYDPLTNTISSNLSKLKICLAHFGGDDEWKKYLESDRDGYTQQLVTKPENGVSFFKNNDLEQSYGLLENIWRGVDWYTIITSLMLQYDNVYADLSYIIHNKEIFPLLKQTLQNEELQKRILFGTDFYVVRNHLTEKEMLANTQANLSKEEFDNIARKNPISYLNLN